MIDRHLKTESAAQSVKNTPDKDVSDIFVAGTNTGIVSIQVKMETVSMQSF